MEHLQQHNSEDRWRNKVKLNHSFLIRQRNVRAMLIERSLRPSPTGTKPSLYYMPYQGRETVPGVANRAARYELGQKAIRTCQHVLLLYVLEGLVPPNRQAPSWTDHQVHCGQRLSIEPPLLPA